MKATQIIHMAVILASGAYLSACSGADVNTTNPDSSAPQHKHASSGMQQLHNMNWRLLTVQEPGNTASARLKSGMAANKINMRIKQGRISFNGGCNNHFGTLMLLEDQQLRVSRLASTKRACRDRAAIQTDHEVADYLMASSRYEMEGDRLKLFTKNQQALSFVGTPTNEARYGGEGETAFFEVRQIDTVVQWREVKYDKNWVRIKNNTPWRSDFPGIKGFSPKHNMRYIVRVKQFDDRSTGKKVLVKDLVTTQAVLQ